MSKPKCITCQFFEAAPEYPREGYGDCRKSPPVVVTNFDQRWPSVEKSDWCGQHQSFVELRGSD